MGLLPFTSFSATHSVSPLANSTLRCHPAVVRLGFLFRPPSLIIPSLMGIALPSFRWSTISRKTSISLPSKSIWLYMHSAMSLANISRATPSAVSTSYLDVSSSGLLLRTPTGLPASSRTRERTLAFIGAVANSCVSPSLAACVR